MDKKKKMRRWGLIVAAVALSAAVLGAALLLPFFTAHPEREGMLYVRPGMSRAALADTLSERFGQRLADRVAWLMKVRDIDPEKKVGAYKITKDMSAVDVWRAVSSGAQTPVRFTFNNLRTVEEFAEAAGRDLAMSKEELLPLLTDSTLCAAHGFTPQTIPAMLLPDTYEVYWSVSPKKLLDKLFVSYNRFWTAERKAKAAKLGLTPTEVATLASIVDAETAYKPEKATIARLYLNRMAAGMKLQSDPTAKFAAGDASIRRVTLAHTGIDSPYNTYQIYGLPPGPIRLPEKFTLDAVLDAPANDYLYMCAKEDFSGSHNFTHSYAEHVRNARRYQQELNRRGIR